MKYRLLLFSIFWLSVRALAQTAQFPVPLSPRIANYQIQVKLNTETKQLDGQETLPV